eukprot:TRINITY_DN80592_c0_g1_i1.p1 TRINITY_DN80592_c0_g1~~TRINITY_DN80592_c0_g1_i1.p1  ORF type:complete len:250 (-),score=24.31 TRINITY_DN80592_c0_g1_i1:372-1121(-)
MAEDAAGTTSPKQSKKWLPLESNPDVLNAFVSKLGFPIASAGFHDVFGLDDDLLAMVPQPALALLFLFVLRPETRSEDAERIAREAEEDTQRAATSPSDVFFVRQTIDNACGTIALLHAIGNNAHALPLAPGSFLQRFFADTKGMTAEERALHLEADTELEEAHSGAAEEGDTRPPSLDECVDLHFVAFVAVGGRLYELDGRRPKPVDHGPSSSDTFLKDASKVIQDVITKSGGSLQFNVISLSLAPPA